MQRAKREEKTMKKRVLCLILSAAMAAFALTGCASGAAPAASSDAGESSESAGGDVFKIGGIGPTTGAAAIYGSDVRDAIQIAVDEINADGGINGFKIEYKFEDDEHNAEKAVNA
ncbi:MAG TPA: amino acid ABC transporter substrate-binding protein, partial [Lachnospiraceae bacterium]|nr:amino acid ABC transporter substrate-binding protein [Lachnospiraceae bacterium]